MKRVKKILKGRYSGKVAIYLLMCCLVLNTSLQVVLADAVPGMIEGENVTYGSATFTTVDDTTMIQTGGMETIIEYTRFNVDGGKTVHFDQPDISAATLNRIIQANPSLINGNLTSNGRVFIINPAGIVFGEGSQVNVAQLVASGLHMSNTDFGNAISDPTQQMIFTGGSGDVTNNGTITATNSVYLVGEDVLNNGAILCPDGLVVMAAGDTLRLGQPGSSVFVDIGTDLIADVDNFATNSGTLGEVGSPVGQVVLAAGDVFSQAIANVGDLAFVANENVMLHDVDVTGSVDVLAGQNPDTDAFLGVNGHITAADIKLKNGAETGPDTVGEITHSPIFIEPTKNLTATDGDVAIQAVHDVFIGGNVEATGDIYINANEDGYDNRPAWIWAQGFYDEYPYGGGDVIADGTITAGGNIYILGNAMRFEGDVTAIGGNLGIAGRLSADPAGQTNVNVGKWGEIRVAAGTVLSAGHDVIIWDGGGGPEDPEPAPGMLQMIGDESLAIVTGTGDYGPGYAEIYLENIALWLEEGGSLTLEEDGYLDLNYYQLNLFNQPATDLTLISHYMSVTAIETGGNPENAADQWASIGAVAQTDITLSGNSGDITTRQLTSATGDIDVHAKAGQLLANEAIEATAGSVILTASDGIDIDGDITAGSDIYLESHPQYGTVSIDIDGDITAGRDIYLFSPPHSSTESAGNLLAGRDVTIFGSLTLDGGHWVLNDDVWSWENGDQFITASTGTITALFMEECWIWKKTPGELNMYGGSHELAIDIVKHPSVLAEDYVMVTAGNLYILGNGDIQISEGVTALGGEYWGGPDWPEIQEGQSVIDPVTVGGVSIVSENGKIYTEDGVDNDTINVAIEGYSGYGEILALTCLTVTARRRLCS